MLTKAGDGQGGDTSRPTRPARAQRRPGSRRERRREAVAAYLFLLPAVVGLALLFLYPLVGTFLTSFTQQRMFGRSEWVGGKNYTRLLGDANLATSVLNSVVYMAINLLGVPIAVVIAAAIHEVTRFKNVYRVLYFLPVVTLPVAVGMVWRFIFNGDFGLLNYVLSLAGIHGEYWLADSRFTIYALSVVGIWMGLGTTIILLGAGLQGIPVEIYEAAALDGANRVRQFLSITLPLLSPTIFFVTILSVINGLQVFDLVFIMLRGSNNTALVGSQTIVYQFYQTAFVEGSRGYGAAIAILLLMIIMAFTLVQFRLQKRWVFYE